MGKCHHACKPPCVPSWKRGRNPKQQHNEGDGRKRRNPKPKPNPPAEWEALVGFPAQTHRGEPKAETVPERKKRREIRNEDYFSPARPPAPNFPQPSPPQSTRKGLCFLPLLPSVHLPSPPPHPKASPRMPGPAPLPPPPPPPGPLGTDLPPSPPPPAGARFLQPGRCPLRPLIRLLPSLPPSLTARPGSAQSASDLLQLVVGGPRRHPEDVVQLGIGHVRHDGRAEGPTGAKAARHRAQDGRV